MGVGGCVGFEGEKGAGVGFCLVVLWNRELGSC